MKYNGLDVVIIKKRNKNTYIRVKDDMKIYITTNYFVSQNEIRNLLDNNNDFINKMIKEKQNKINKDKEFYFLGKEYKIENNPSKEEIEKWYKKQANKVFKERLDVIYKTMKENIPYPNLTIRKMKTRWGVCNKKLKRVTLNLELIRKEEKYIDYVIIHELCHFVHMNHSRAFWQLVSKYEKNYKELRKELKKV